MTAFPKMDDDGLTREQIVGLKDALLDHEIPPCTQGQWRYVCDLALQALKSRSEVLEDETAWLIERGQAFNQSPPIWWKFDEGKSSRPNAGYASYEERWTEDANCARRFSTKEAAEAYAAVEISHLYLVTEHRWLAASVKSPRAEPGAPNIVPMCPENICITPKGCAMFGCKRAEHESEYAAEQAGQSFFATAVHDPFGRTMAGGVVGYAGPASAAPEVAAPVTRKEPEPLVANRDGTAAAPDVKEIVERLRALPTSIAGGGYRFVKVPSDLFDDMLILLESTHARGREEGLEEAAKVACKACLDEFCKFEELLPESFTLNQMEEMVEASIQIAIRAKIKPGSWKGGV